MKLVSRILSLLVLASATVFYSSCGGGDDNSKSETDQQLEKLNGTWVIAAGTDVTQDGHPQDGTNSAFNYKGLTLTINGSAGSTTFNWTAAARPQLSPWDSQGTFQFGDPVASQLKRSDNVTITYNVTDTELIMSFTFTGQGYAGSRSKSVEGDWHFEFTKQK